MLPRVRAPPFETRVFHRAMLTRHGTRMRCSPAVAAPGMLPRRDARTARRTVNLAAYDDIDDIAGSLIAAAVGAGLVTAADVYYSSGKNMYDLTLRMAAEEKHVAVTLSDMKHQLQLLQAQQGEMQASLMEVLKVVTDIRQQSAEHR